MKYRFSGFLLFVLSGISIIGIIFALIMVNRPAIKESTTIAIVIANEGRNEKITGLKKGLQELGFRENEQVHFVTISLHGRREEEKGAVDTIQRVKPDILVTTGAWETAIAKKATKEVPIIFIGIASPETLGWVPSAMISGIDNGQIKLIGKRLELVTHWMPSARRILVLADAHAPTTERAILEADQAGQELGLDMEVLKISSRAEWKEKLNGFERGQYDVLLPLPSFLLEDSITDSLPTLMDKKLFVMGAYPEQVKKGLFAAYGISFIDQGKEAAKLVAKVINGHMATGSLELPDAVMVSIHRRNMESLGVKLNNQQMSVVHQYYGEEGR